MSLLNLHLDLYEQYAEAYRRAHVSDRKIIRHVAGRVIVTTPQLSYEPLKHFFKIYVNNFPGASDLRARLMETHTVNEARAVLDEIDF